MSLINDALKRASSTVKEQGSEPAEGAPPMEPVETPPTTSSGGGGKKWLLLLVVALILGLSGYFFWQAYRTKQPAQMAAAKPGTNTPAKAAGATNSSNAKTGAVAALTKTNDSAKKIAAPVKVSTNILVRSVQTAATVAEKVSLQNREGEAAAYSIQPATPPPAEAPAPAPVTPTPTPVAVVPPPAPVQPAPVVPTATPAQSNAEFPAMRLQAIYYRIKAPSAMINGDNVHVGDMIEGVAKVAKIERDSVTVEIGARSKVLNLR